MPSIRTAVLVLLLLLARRDARTIDRDPAPSDHSHLAVRELERVVVVPSETGEYSFGLFMAAAGPYLAVEDRDPSGYVVRIGHIDGERFEEEARFPQDGLLQEIAASDAVFVWRSIPSAVFVARRSRDGRWSLETIELDDRCRYVPHRAKYVWIEGELVVVNSAENICIFERGLVGWRRTAIIAHGSGDDQVAYAKGRVITNEIGTDRVEIYARAQGWQRTRTIQLSRPSELDGLAASDRWLVAKAVSDLDVVDLETGLRQRIARRYTTDFVIANNKILAVGFEAELYAFTGAAWELDARIPPTRSILHMALADHAWITPSYEGYVEGFDLGTAGKGKTSAASGVR